MRVWMAMDPESRRVMVQAREFSDGDFPPGLRGLGWPTRQADVDAKVYDKILAATLSDDTVDYYHRKWWDDVRKEGEPMWPDLPVRKAQP